MGIKMVWTISYTFLCHNVSISRWSLIRFLIYWYTSKTQLQESQLSQYDRVSSLPCFLQCDTVTFYITYHSMSDLTVSYTIHHMNCFQQITWLAFFPIVTRFVFCVQLCMIGMSHDPHGKSHMNDMYCRMTFT